MLSALLIPLLFLTTSQPNPTRATPAFLGTPVSPGGESNSLGQINSAHKLAIAANGDIYVLYRGDRGVFVARSQDRGQNFLPPVQVTSANGEAEIVAGTNGAVYVIYPGSQGYYLLSWSTDRGATFHTISVVGKIEAGTVHLVSSGPYLYALDAKANTLYINDMSGPGGFTDKYLAGSDTTFTEVLVDPATGEIWLAGSDPSLFISASQNHGRSFGPIYRLGGEPIFYPAAVLMRQPTVRYLYLAGGAAQGSAGDEAYRINLADMSVKHLTFGQNLAAHGRSLATDNQGRLVDGYHSWGTNLVWQISYDQGESFVNAHSLSAADVMVVGISPANSDVVAVYEKSGLIYANTYRNELNATDLALTLSLDNAKPTLNQTVNFKVEVSNRGPVPATGVQVTDKLPTSLKFVSYTASQGVYDPATGIWGVASLGVDGKATLDLTAQVVKSNSSFANSAKITSLNEIDLDSANNVQEVSGAVGPAADLQLKLEASNAAPQYGQELRYRLSLYNAGPDEAGPVQVSSPLPAGLTYLSHSATLGSFEPKQGVWSLPNLAAAQTATLEIVTTTSRSNGPITSQASLIALSATDPEPANNTATVTINVPPAADLAVRLTTNNADPQYGEKVELVATVINNGPDRASQVQAKIQLPAGLDYQGYSASQGSFDVTTAIWQVGPLENGQQAAFNLSGKISKGGALVSTLNLLPVSEYDYQPANDTDQAVLHAQGLVNFSGLVAQLRGNPDREVALDSGGQVTYELRVKNTGNATATSVKARLPLDPNLSVAYVEFSSPLGWVSKVETASNTPYMEMTLPNLASGESVSANVHQTARAGVLPGSQIYSRFSVSWDDEQAQNNHQTSNAIRFTLTANSTRNESNGGIQFFDPASQTVAPGSSIKLHSDFYAPKERVALWYTDPNGQAIALNDAYADSQGNLTLTLTLPKAVIGQSYTISGYGSSSEVMGNAAVMIVGPENLR